MAPIYSFLLFSAQGVSSPAVIGPVPGGVVWIVRDITAFTGSLIVNSEFHAIDEETGATFWYESNSAAAKQAFHWTGRQVFESGDAGIRLTTDGHPWDFRISGYELTAP